MDRLGLLRLVVLLCLVSMPASAQQTSQGASILQQSLAALTGGATVTDVTMTGTVTVLSGSTTASGTITLVGTVAGQSQLTLALPSGNWVTTENFATNPRTSSVAGPSGTTQDTAPEELMGPSPAWFCPVLVIINAAVPNNFVVSYVGQETSNGSPAQHVAIWPQAVNSFPVSSGGPQAPPGPSLPSSRPGQQELYVNPSTFLPETLVLRVRGYGTKNSVPDPTQPMSLTEEVLFSNYQQVAGGVAAFHVQVLLGGTPLMDIQLSSVRFNTGVTVAAN